MRIRTPLMGGPAAGLNSRPPKTGGAGVRYFRDPSPFRLGSPSGVAAKGIQPRSRNASEKPGHRDGTGRPGRPEPNALNEQLPCQVAVVEVYDCEGGAPKARGGNWPTFQNALRLAETDYRDLRMAAGLGGKDWPRVLAKAGFRVPEAGASGCARKGAK